MGINIVKLLTQYVFSTAWPRYSQPAIDFWACRRVPYSQLCLNWHVYHIHGYPGGTADRIYYIQVRLFFFFLLYPYFSFVVAFSFQICVMKLYDSEYIFFLYDIPCFFLVYTVYTLYYYFFYLKFEFNYS